MTRIVDAEDLRNCKYGFLKRLFCKHDWEKIGFREAEDKDILYSMRHYECLKCKKDIWVDGRYDKKGNYSH